MSADTLKGDDLHATSPYVQPEYSGWECELFGCGESLVLRPVKGQVPNAFWRLMQRLAFGNKWRKL